MRLSNLFHFCLLGLASAASWRLDKSCKENGLEDMVVAATESAYSMAKNLQASIEDASNKKEISANNGQVIEWMFMPDDHSYKTSYQVMQATGKLNQSLRKLANTTTRDDSASTTDPNNIVIYCDLSRFQKTEDEKGKTRYFDKDVNGLIEPNDSINACKGILPPTLAYTMPWIDNNDKASQIQLCPWLLNWAKKLDGLIAENKVDKKGKYVEKIANKMVEHDFVLSPIDIESVLDKLILHEMQHTKVANLAVDMDESSVKKIKYGWKRCRALAKEGDISQLRRPDTNADSIALAGFAIKLFGEGVTVHEDGKLTKSS